MDYAGGGGFSARGSGGGGNYGGGGGGYGEGGGGGGAMSQSSPERKARRPYDQQTLIPVTVSMILNSTPVDEDDSASAGGGTQATCQLRDGRRLAQVKFLGAPREVDEMSTNLVYNIYDGTGIIEVKNWLNDTDTMFAKNTREVTKALTTYLCVIGVVRDYNGKKVVVADSIRPLSTGNELAHHMLQVVYAAQEYEKQNSYVRGGGGGPPNINRLTSSSAVTPIGATSSMPLQAGGVDTALRETLLQIIGTESSDMHSTGCSVYHCVQQLTGRYQPDVVRKALNDMAGDGYIYSTTDEDHYKVCGGN